MGCDRKRIDALVEHVNAILFNSAIHARNEDFEKQTQLHQGREWTYQWSKEHPVGDCEIDWKSHSSCSEQVFYKDLGRDPRAFQEAKNLCEGWGDIEALGKLAKVVFDQGMLKLNMYVCDDCGYNTVATNRLCPFCKRHLKELLASGAPGGAQETTGSRIIRRLAKGLIADNECPGFAFPYRGMHRPMWWQMMTLVKYHWS